MNHSPTAPSAAGGLPPEATVPVRAKPTVNVVSGDAPSALETDTTTFLGAVGETDESDSTPSSMESDPDPFTLSISLLYPVDVLPSTQMLEADTAWSMFPVTTASPPMPPLAVVLMPMSAFSQSSLTCFNVKLAAVVVKFNSNVIGTPPDQPMPLGTVCVLPVHPPGMPERMRSLATSLPEAPIRFLPFQPDVIGRCSVNELPVPVPCTTNIVCTMSFARRGAWASFRVKEFGSSVKWRRRSRLAAVPCANTALVKPFGGVLCAGAAILS